jgi:lysyl-tRNA synthetase class II
MKERTLLKIALVCGIAGITVLFFASMMIDETDTGNPELEPEGSSISFVGTLESIRNSSSTTFITIKKTTTTPIVMFKANNIPLRKGDLIEIRGKTEKNDGKVQLIADEVRLLG